MNMNIWLDKARDAIAELPNLKCFEVRSLFPEYEWNALPKGDRIAFGKVFKGEVLEGRFEGVLFLDRARNNHAKYQKIREIEQ